MKPIIRTLTPADAAAFYDLRLQGLELYPEAFGEAAADWRARSLDKVRTFLNDRHAVDGKFILGAFDGDHLVGVAGLQRRNGPKFQHKGEVWGMIVRPTHQNQGVAGALVDGLIDRARKVDGLRRLTLCHVEGNTAAARLYTSRGFREYGCEPEALVIGTTAHAEIYMSLAL